MVRSTGHGEDHGEDHGDHDEEPRADLESPGPPGPRRLQTPAPHLLLHSGHVGGVAQHYVHLVQEVEGVEVVVEVQEAHLIL